MDVVDKIMKYEDGGMEYEEYVQFFQELVDTGYINYLQGSYQRTVRDLIDSGEVLLSKDPS